MLFSKTQGRGTVRLRLSQDVQFMDNGVTELGCEFLGRTLGFGRPRAAQRADANDDTSKTMVNDSYNML